MQEDLPGPRLFLSQSYTEFKSRFKTLFSISFLSIASLLVPGFITFYIKNVWLELFMIALAFLCFIYFQFMLIVAIVSKEDNWSNLFSLTFKKIFPWGVVNLMKGILVGLGYIALLLPGIYLSFAYIFAGIAFLDQGLKGKQALDFSSKITKGKKVFIFINLLGIGALYLVITMPTNFVIKMLGIRLVKSIFDILVTLFFAPFSQIFSYKLYLYLKDNNTAPIPQEVNPQDPSLV